MQIPLGILLKSETNYDDMMDILDHYQNYVPSVSCEKDIPDTSRMEDNHFLTTLVGGDYLSVARARGAQLIRSTSVWGQPTEGERENETKRKNKTKKTKKRERTLTLRVTL